MATDPKKVLRYVRPDGTLRYRGASYLVEPRSAMDKNLPAGMRQHSTEVYSVPGVNSRLEDGTYTRLLLYRDPEGERFLGWADRVDRWRRSQ